MLIDSAPATLDPRESVDAIGQRLEMLAFRAITTLDADLNPVPDLSEKWRLEKGGKRVVFTIRDGLTDHAGERMTPERVYRCVRNYLFVEPKSLHESSFPTLLDVNRVKNELIFDLKGADPYLPRNLSVLRYFSVAGHPDEPCRAPAPGEKIITNGDYAISPYPERFDREVRMKARTSGAPDLVFELVRDETSRLFKLLNGEGDLVLNSFSPTKTDWISEGNRHGFTLISRSGTNASYLGFNFRDPIMRVKKVRLAIAHAIDREKIARNKLRDQAAAASSFLSPDLPEAIPMQPFAFDPALSERLLDDAGFPRGKDGVRFRIKQKTTTNREGLEMNQVLRDMLARIGIAVDLDPVEPAVFFAAIRKGNFQMYLSRWVGVADGSILYRSLRTGVKDNRVAYSDATMDEWLDRALHETDLRKRKELLGRVQYRMLEELPYFPLWIWTNALILRDTIEAPKPSELSLSGSYFPIRSLRFKAKP